MNKLFSLKIFVDGLKNTKVFGLIVIALTTLSSVLPAVMTVFNTAQNHALFNITANNFAPWAAILLLLAPLAVYVQLHFSNSRTASDYYHSLPLTKTELYLSTFLSSLTWIAIAILIPTLINTVLYIFAPYVTLNIATPFIFFAVYFCAAFLLMSTMFAAMSLTGTVLSNLFVFGIFALFFRLIFYIISEFFSKIVPILPPTNILKSYLSPYFYLPFRLLTLLLGYAQPEPPIETIVYALIIAIILFVLGLVFFSRRKSEMANTSSVNRAFQNIFRIAIALPTALLTVFGLFENLLGRPNIISSRETAILFAVTVFVYFIYEIITKKGISTLKKCVPQIFIVFLISTMAYGAIKATENKILSYSPLAEEIQSIRYELGGGSYERINLSNQEFSDEATFKKVANSLSIANEKCRSGKFQLYSVTIVHIKDIHGNVKSRLLPSDSCGALDVFDELIHTHPQLCDTYEKIPDKSQVESVTVSWYDNSRHTMPESFWDVFSEEYFSLSHEEKVDVKTRDNSDLLSFHVNGSHNGQDFTSYYHLTEKMPKTAQYIFDICYSASQVSRVSSFTYRFLYTEVYPLRSNAEAIIMDFKNGRSFDFELYAGPIDDDDDYSETIGMEEMTDFLGAVYPHYSTPPSSDTVVIYLSLEYSDELIFSVPDELYDELYKFAKTQV